MQSRPDHPTLLEALASFLMTDIAPRVEADKALQFRVLIAANLATVIAGEVRTQTDRRTEEGARLAKLLGEPAPATAEALEAMNRTLAQRLQLGQLTGDATLEHLLQTARETLAVTNPRFELDAD